MKTEVSPRDVYFVYDSKSHWKSGVTEQDYWQQQLGSLKNIAAKHFRPELEKKIKGMLAGK